MAMTRQAPTVCSAATVAGAEQREEQDLQARAGLSPTARAWLSSKNTTIRSFHLSEQDRQRDDADDDDLQGIVVGDAEDVAEHDRLHVHGRRVDARRSAGRRRRTTVKTRPMTASSRSRVCAAHERHAERRQQPGGEGAGRVGQLEQIGARRRPARSSAPAHRPSATSPSASGRPTGTRTAPPTSAAHPHGLDHVVVGEGRQQLAHQLVLRVRLSGSVGCVRARPAACSP